MRCVSPSLCSSLPHGSWQKRFSLTSKAGEQRGSCCWRAANAPHGASAEDGETPSASGDYRCFCICFGVFAYHWDLMCAHIQERDPAMPCCKLHSLNLTRGHMGPRIPPWYPLVLIIRHTQVLRNAPGLEQDALLALHLDPKGGHLLHLHWAWAAPTFNTKHINCSKNCQSAFNSCPVLIPV